MVNKQGIMVEFLVTVLLAIIIFVPACLFVSEFFRVSDQAKDNFIEFTKTVETMKDGQKTTSLLIMDEGTALIYFEPGFSEVVVDVDAELPKIDYTLHLQKPGQCPPEAGCFYLFQGPLYESSPTKTAFTITDPSPICRKIDTPLTLSNCGLGEPHFVNSYSCHKGFVIERNLAKDSSLLIRSYYESPRRLALQVSKEQGVIHLEG